MDIQTPSRLRLFLKRLLTLLSLSPDNQAYAIHVRDAVRKVERDYKVTTQNNTVEYLLKDLEPGGRYSVSVRLRNMSKEASFTLSTGTNRKSGVTPGSPTGSQG